jgi:hypothetical protein
VLSRIDDRYVGKILDAVQGAVGQGEAYYVLVLLLMTNVCAQCHKLCAFVDSFYIEVTGISGFAADKAWALVGRCVAGLFGALQPYRSPVTMLEDLGTLVRWKTKPHAFGQLFSVIVLAGSLTRLHIGVTPLL